MFPYDGSHMSLAGWLWMALFWSVLLGLLFAAVIGIWRPQSRRADDGRAILELRLARGEVTIEEYDQLRKILEGAR